MSDPFSTISFELLSSIYYDSANPFLPLASPYLYASLSGEHTRVMFCANLFDPTYEWDLDNYPRLDVAQTEVVRRPWFDLSLAGKVSNEVGRRMRGGSRELPRVITGAKLPPRLLHGPWAPDKVALLQRLVKWGLRTHWSREKREYPGLNEAIDGGLPEIVDFFCGPSAQAKIEEQVILHAINSDASLKILWLLIGGRYGYDYFPEFKNGGIYQEIEKRCPPEEIDPDEVLHNISETEDEERLQCSKWSKLLMLIRSTLLAQVFYSDSAEEEYDDFENGEEDFDELEEDSAESEEEEEVDEDNDETEEDEQEGDHEVAAQQDEH